jgi:malate/lactate dehydrogenase
VISYDQEFATVEGGALIIDRDVRRAEGHVDDLRDAEVFSQITRGLIGDFSHCRSADITVITAGSQPGGPKAARIYQR